MNDDSGQPEVNECGMERDLDGRSTMVSQTKSSEVISNGVQAEQNLSNNSSESHVEIMSEKDSIAQSTDCHQIVTGKPPSGHNGRGHSDSSHGDLRRLSVSPRVELMLNNELFKKYLKKHGNLLDKLSQRQGRTRGGLKKAFSNLDLSQIDLEQEFCDPFHSKRIESVEASKEPNAKDKETKVSVEGSKPSQNPAKQRSMSLIGHNDPHLQEIQEALKLHEQNNVDKKKTKVTRLAASDRKSRFSLPSFEDFKRSQRAKLLKGQAYVRNVINNKENVPTKLLKDLHNKQSDSSQSSHDTLCTTQNGCLNQSLPEQQLREMLSRNHANLNSERTDVCDPTNNESVLENDDANLSKRATEKTLPDLSKPPMEKTLSDLSKPPTEKSLPDLSKPPTEKSLPDLSKPPTEQSSSVKESQETNLSDPNCNFEDLKCENIDENVSRTVCEKDNKTLEKMKSTDQSLEEKVINAGIPEMCLKDSPTRSSKKKRAPNVPPSESARDITGDIPPDTVNTTREICNPLEISTDGTTVYAYLKISSFDTLNSGNEEKSCLSYLNHHDNNKTASLLQQHGIHCNKEGSKVKLVCDDVNCNISNRCDLCLNTMLENDSLHLKKEYTSVSAMEKTNVSQSIPKPSLDKLETREDNSLMSCSYSASSPETPNTRTILKASRKRKLPGKNRSSQKGETKELSSKLTPSRTWPKLTHSVSVDLESSETSENGKHTRKSKVPPPLPLLRSSSCDLFSYHTFLDAESPYSPATFSFPNSPAYDGSTIFMFPSPSGSLTNSETDLSASNSQDKEYNNSGQCSSQYDALPTDSKSIIVRSTSDVSANTSDAHRRRRDRKQRPYKSDPIAGSGNFSANRASQFLLGKQRYSPGSIKDDLLDFPDDPSLEEVDENEEDEGYDQSKMSRKIKHRLSNISDISTDSGMIGPESIPDAPPSPSSSIFSQTSLFSSQHSTGPDSAIETSEGPNCTDIDEKSFVDLDTNVEKSVLERKETILEIRATELSYGRDLKILKEEFYKPLKNSGLLNSDQLEAIFLNLEELIHVNTQFTNLLDSAVDIARQDNDENLTDVVIGDIFLKSTKLIMTFENYCVHQSQATILLEQLERERELLRIFLKVCQDEHTVLRRMHLKSFLMVPVQRVMKYPLLLERLYRATSVTHHDRDAILSAKNKIEAILEHINAKAKSSGQVKIGKRRSNERRSVSTTEKKEVARVAMEALGWNKQEVCDVITSQVQVAPQGDNWATKRLRNIRFTQVHAVLLTLGQNVQLQRVEENGLLFPQKSSVIQAAVVLLKEKNGKFQTFRDPFLLNRCIVNLDAEIPNTFELQELNKDTYLFKYEDQDSSKLWLQNAKQQTLNLGTWRKRRNALPNIMIKHLV